ncbi:Meiotically up-regulated gene 69 protein [Smittium mucronatum]|uniref:Meiotically up-regulated gene 69 protein n=1 Tax=Smittium mucronatum TaxID=133383 RepID=A0A1R0H9P6_9FUNG|nr:Meiotically up-regulated gene 69 protein [Smittium mucronatum]
MDMMFMVVNGIYLLFRFGFGYSGLTWRTILAYGVTLTVESFFYVQLYKISQPKFDSKGLLLSSGEDLSSAGLISYMFDFIYITWAIHLLSLVVSFAWWFYLSIPIYFVYMFGGKVLSLFKMSSSDQTQEPSKSKRREKLEKKQAKFGSMQR